MADFTLADDITTNNDDAVSLVALEDIGNSCIAPPTCPTCQKPFDTSGTHCQECLKLLYSNEGRDVQTDAAIIHRKDNIALNNLESLSGAEAHNLDLDHEQFVVHNLVHDETGAERPDWNERVIAHIKDIRLKIESFRIKEGAARRVRAEKLIVDTAKLSPEERDAWKKALDKPTKVVKVAEPKKPTASAVEKQIAGLLKLGIPEDSDMIKTLRAKL